LKYLVQDNSWPRSIGSVGYALALDMTARDLQSVAKVAARFLRDDFYFIKWFSIYIISICRISSIS
jgi:hypothetical protein